MNTPMPNCPHGLPDLTNPAYITWCNKFGYDPEQQVTWDAYHHGGPGVPLAPGLHIDETAPTVDDPLPGLTWAQRYEDWGARRREAHGLPDREASNEALADNAYEAVELLIEAKGLIVDLQTGMVELTKTATGDDDGLSADDALGDAAILECSAPGCGHTDRVTIHADGQPWCPDHCPTCSAYNEDVATYRETGVLPDRLQAMLRDARDAREAHGHNGHDEHPLAGIFQSMGMNMIPIGQIHIARHQDGPPTSWPPDWAEPASDETVERLRLVARGIDRGYVRESPVSVIIGNEAFGDIPTPLVPLVGVARWVDKARRIAAEARR